MTENEKYNRLEDLLKERGFTEIPLEILSIKEDDESFSFYIDGNCRIEKKK